MSRLLPLLTWLAFPVYVWQGLGVRRRTERMLPARGPVLHAHRGKGAGDLAAGPWRFLRRLGRHRSAPRMGLPHSSLH